MGCEFSGQLALLAAVITFKHDLFMAGDHWFSHLASSSHEII